MAQTADILKALTDLTKLNERVRQLADATERLAGAHTALRDRVVRLEVKAETPRARPPGKK